MAGPSRQHPRQTAGGSLNKGSGLGRAGACKDGGSRRTRACSRSSGVSGGAAGACDRGGSGTLASSTRAHPAAAVAADCGDLRGHRGWPATPIAPVQRARRQASVGLGAAATCRPPTSANGVQAGGQPPGTACQPRGAASGLPRRVVVPQRRCACSACNEAGGCPMVAGAGSEPEEVVRLAAAGELPYCCPPCRLGALHCPWAEVPQEVPAVAARVGVLGQL